MKRFKPTAEKTDEYIIAFESRPRVLHIQKGPVKNEKEMLDTFGDYRHVIIRVNTDLTKTFLWYWDLDEGDWVEWHDGYKPGFD